MKDKDSLLKNKHNLFGPNLAPNPTTKPNTNAECNIVTKLVHTGNNKMNNIYIVK